MPFSHVPLVMRRIDSSRFSPAARGTPLAAVAAMDATCAGCGQTIPDFSRVCEHCGHRSAEQLPLPTVATSPQRDPEPNTATKGFDFTPDPADFAPESFDFPTSSDPDSLDAGDFEPLEDSIFRFEAERVVEEISAATSTGSSSVEGPAEAQVPVEQQRVALWRVSGCGGGTRS